MAYIPKQGDIIKMDFFEIMPDDILAEVCDIVSGYTEMDKQ